MVIAVGNDAQFAACVRALGLDALAADAALVTNAGRVTHRTRVVEAIAAHVRGRTAASVMQALDGVGVPCGVVKPVLEALRAVDGSALSGVVPQGPTSVRRPPPRLDAHGTLVRTDGWGAFLRGEGAEDV
jgi:crotonobetainyl-CoA:carnitine CoA-transferase CaiB-like acyl-CoA transferase